MAGALHCTPFETLQLRLHSASRIAELSGKFPARLVVLDLLAGRDDRRPYNDLLRGRRYISIRISHPSCFPGLR
jgi:hypothetical protein